jgi:hypothetical protein
MIMIIIISFNESMSVSDGKGVFTTLSESIVLLSHLCLFFLYKFQVLVSEILRKIFQNPLMFHQLQGFNPFVRIPIYI